VGLRFDPEQLELLAGKTGQIVLQNQDDEEHTFVINELNVAMLAAPGQTVRAEVQVHPANTGRFPFYCSIPGHRAAGMEGSVLVRR
jgi:nitrite reductase (NO-forming)